jgi:hypothetical protein
MGLEENIFDKYWLYKVYSDWGYSDRDFNMNYFIQIFGHENRHRSYGYGWSLNGWMYD